MPLDLIATVGEVTLGGRALQIIPNTYQRFAVTPFAPRIAATNPSHGTLDAWQAESITDWSHGFGFPDALDMAGYNITSGNIDTRQPHELRIATALNGVANPTTVVNCMADLWHSSTNGGCYFGLDTSQNGTTVYRSDHTGTMAAVNGASCPTTTVTDLIAATNVNGTPMLFVALSDTSDVAFKVYDPAAGTWASGTNGASTAYAKYWAIAGGFLWYADRANNVYYSDDPTDAWSAAIPVGWKSHKITSLCEFNGLLYVGKENGLYVVDPATEIAKSVMVFRDQARPDEKRMMPMVVWNGYLYFYWRGTLYRMSPGGAISDVTPPKFGTTFPYVRYDNVRAMVSGSQYLYYTAKHTDSAAWDLLAFDGIGHHRLLEITTAANGVLHRSMYPSDVNSPQRLWVCAVNGTTGALSYMPTNEHVLPYDSYPVNGTHYLETSRFDMGLPEIVKSWKDITLEMENVNAGRSVEVQFATDDNNTFTSMGTGQEESGNQTRGASVVNGLADTGNVWDNLENMKTRDGVYAVCFLGSAETDSVKLTGFGFLVPTVAQITGVAVSVYGNGNTFYSTVKLVIAGTAAGNNKASGSLQDKTFGASNDNWGNTLTPAIVNASNFGVQIKFAGGLEVSAYVDYVGMTVYYSSFSRYVTLQFDRADGIVTSANAGTFVDTVGLLEADDTWDGAVVDIVSGTGAGQTRLISSYNGGNSTCTLLEAWSTVPDTTSRYQITWQSRKIRFRIVMATNSASNTVVVKSFTMRFQPRPRLKYGWRFSVRAADLMERNHGAIPGNTGSEDIADLCFFWRDVKAPIQFEDKDGQTYYVEVSEAAATEVGYNPGDTPGRGQTEYVVQMSLVQA